MAWTRQQIVGGYLYNSLGGSPVLPTVTGAYGADPTRPGIDNITGDATAHADAMAAVARGVLFVAYLNGCAPSIVGTNISVNTGECALDGARYKLDAAASLNFTGSGAGTYHVYLATGGPAYALALPSQPYVELCTVVWSGSALSALTDLRSYYQVALQHAPGTHAASHAAAGSDPVSPASIGAVANTGGETIAGAKAFSSAVAVTPVSNQLVLGTTNTVTLNAAAPVASRIITIPEVGTDASVVLTAGAQTVGGAKTFSSAIIVNPTTNQIVLGVTNTYTINATAPAASRTITLADPLTNASFVLTEGAQTVNGVKTFGSAPSVPQLNVTGFAGNGSIVVNPTLIGSGNTILMNFQPTWSAANSSSIKSGIYAKTTIGATGAITNGVKSVHIDTLAVTGGGSVDTHYGLYVAAQSGATNNYAVYFADAGGTASGGITFNDTNLYRSTTTTLKTDGSLIVGGATLTLADACNIVLNATTGTKIGTSTSQKLGFFNSAPVAKQTVTGSRGSNAALASLLTALATLGLVVDSSS